MKLGCIGHIEKQVGTALCEFHKKNAGQLKDGLPVENAIGTIVISADINFEQAKHHIKHAECHYGCAISQMYCWRWKDTSSPLQGKIHGVNLTNWVFSKQTPPPEPDLPRAPWASFQKLSRESLLCCCLPRHDDLQEIFSRHHMVPWVFFG